MSDDFTLDDNPNEAERCQKCKPGLPCLDCQTHSYVRQYKASNQYLQSRIVQQGLNQANQGLNSQIGVSNQQAAIGNRIDAASYQRNLNAQWRQWYLIIANMTGNI